METENRIKVPEAWGGGYVHGYRVFLGDDEKFQVYKG